MVATQSVLQSFHSCTETAVPDFELTDPTEGFLAQHNIGGGKPTFAKLFALSWSTASEAIKRGIETHHGEHRTGEAFEFWPKLAISPIYVTYSGAPRFTPTAPGSYDITVTLETFLY